MQNTNSELPSSKEAMNKKENNKKAGDRESERVKQEIYPSQIK
jgi:hypothetical protein